MGRQSPLVIDTIREGAGATGLESDYRRDRPVCISLSMSEGERVLTISADYPLSFVFARARFCPDIRKILEEMPLLQWAPVTFFSLQSSIPFSG